MHARFRFRNLRGYADCEPYTALYGQTLDKSLTLARASSRARASQRTLLAGAGDGHGREGRRACRGGIRKRPKPQSSPRCASDRYQRGAIVLTSNRDLVEVGELFGDALLASAAMDRLLDDAHVITIEGDSFRNPPKDKRDAKKKAIEKAKESNR